MAEELSETEKITCEACGFETEVSWRRRRSHVRWCRDCGAQIAEPKELQRYEEAPAIVLTCDIEGGCPGILLPDGWPEEICCVSCPASKGQCQVCFDAKAFDIWDEEPDAFICLNLGVAFMETRAKEDPP